MNEAMNTEVCIYLGVVGIAALDEYIVRYEVVVLKYITLQRLAKGEVSLGLLTSSEYPYASDSHSYAIPVFQQCSSFLCRRRGRRRELLVLLGADHQRS
jgi:hypothetical protein